MTDVIYKVVLAGLLLLFFPPGMAATDHTVETIPNVRLTDRTNHVSNPDDILSENTIRNINMYLQALEDSTGIEVAVVAVYSIGDNDARMFATDLFEHWGIGKNADDNGLLIQLVTEPSQRSVVFETGYGLEGVLPDAICYRLQQRYMIPDMKDGNYDSGMLNGVIAVTDYLLSSDYERQAITGDTSEDDLPFWAAFLMIMGFPITLILIVLLSTYIKHRPRVCPKCGQKTLVFVRQQTIQRATYTSEGLVADIYRCKNCGYTEEQKRRTSRIRREAAGGPIIMGGGGFGGSRGGGFSGGSFGGGRSGGGGSISRF
ncbi:uncharacterized protein M2459_000894 [Parabacteroides sp. PF5-5]|uniref:TPM domain-containing protein n=1 Tax=unclassified Parabacteroides TaxID=2649774 RepID=UPI0024746F70|nr:MULTISPECIES: TPM domain-containing protein [unclassified Parabacteroides]MDH6304166.1 uncharacterized protein [Parabacteroides sp. PH5-39]MDH6315118.1 uncharacterized protein [Parabacteroides sp. PF5-13]MDH6318779.1 uncharacterized protein [Parabacteroides sp. PH5-13]MDH6322508.1 uncharacterized protein [Parabacteroides sp. PH5-8]MDH6326356.1 uncharacterized protein [Parabacteroides sp. PH5-41]